MVIQAYAPTSNAEEAEIEWYYEDLQDLLELTPKKDVLFIVGDWNAKVGGQETPGVTGKFGLGVQNEEGQRLTEFCQENTLVMTHPGRQAFISSGSKEPRSALEWRRVSLAFKICKAHLHYWQGL